MVAARTRTLAGLAVVLVLAFGAPASAKPPADAFCVILFEGEDDFRTLRVLVDLETNLTQREDLFAQLDADGDGGVDLMEQESLRASTVRQWDTSASLGIRSLSMAAGDGVQQWGASFTGAKTWTQVGHTFHKQHHTTPALITDPSDLETQEVREFHFEHPHEPILVQVTGGQDPNATPTPTTTTSSSSSTSYTVAVEYVVVRANPGWLVDAVNGWSYDSEVSGDPDVAELDLPAFDTKKPFSFEFKLDLPTSTSSSSPVPVTQTITVVQEGSTTPAGETGRGSPALPVTLAFVAVGLALAIRRRL